MTHAHVASDPARPAAPSVESAAAVVFLSFRGTRRLNVVTSLWETMKERVNE